jgi:transposase
MAIVGAFDVHRRQITFDYWDSDTGRVQRGRVIACREVLRSWLDRFAQCGEVMFAVEGCTGWRFVVEELRRAGIQAHLAEPADAATARGPKRRAKTDRADALLAQGRLPESWIPPGQVLEMRTTLELFKDLREEHTAWVQRLHATCSTRACPPRPVMYSPAPSATNSKPVLGSRRLRIRRS